MDIHRLKPILDRLIQPDDQWNFDLEDCDHILRVVTWSIPALTIIDEVKNAGYRCEELEDLIPMPIQVIRSIDWDHTRIEKVMCGY